MATPALTPADLVQRLFRARRDGAIDAIVDLLTDDFYAEALADGKRFPGRDAVRAHLLAQAASEERTEVSYHRVLESGDRALAEGRLRVLTRRGLSDSPAVWVFTVRDQRLAAISPFGSVAAALREYPEFADTA